MYIIMNQHTIGLDLPNTGGQVFGASKANMALTYLTQLIHYICRCGQVSGASEDASPGAGQPSQRPWQGHADLQKTGGTHA